MNSTVKATTMKEGGLWEQKSLKMFYFTPIVANGKLVKLKGKKMLDKQNMQHSQAWLN